MIAFKPLRTRRHTIEFKELSIAQIVELLAIPEQLNELSTSKFIEMATGQDSSEWTVQERMLAVTHYLGHVGAEKGDFTVCQLGNQSWRLSDYFAGEDYPAKDKIELEEIAGDNWWIKPLTGRDACAIEELQGTVEGIKGYLHWKIGMMAAQMYTTSEEPAPTDNQYDEWLQNRMRVFSHYPESVFLQLLTAFHKGSEQLNHLFLMGADENGLVAKEVDDAPPARFRGLSAIGDTTRQICR